MTEKKNERLKAAFLDVVDNQIRDNTPPEARKTYKRLLAEGFSDQEARELIGAVVSGMLYEMLKDKEKYDKKREKQYVKDLRRLPKLPWE